MVRALLLLIGSLGVHAPAQAQTPVPRASFADLEHTLLVRKALAGDRELGKLNLGVKVENRVATLWGPIPSGQLSSKAVKVARAVPDIVEVRSYFFLDESEAAEPKYLPDPGMTWAPAPQGPTPFNAPLLPSTQPAGPAPAQTTAADKKEGVWHAAATEKSTAYKPITIEGGSGSDDQGLFVLPPIAVPSTLDPGQSQSGVPLAVTLQDRVAHLKAGDWRYQYLQLQVEDHRVYVNGQVYQWNDLQQLTQAIARLPGVQNVIVGQVQIKGLK